MGGMGNQLDHLLNKDFKPKVINGNTIYQIDGFDECGEDCTLGLDESSRLLPLFNGREAMRFAALGTVADIMLAEFVFRGLKRPLMQRDNKKADADKLIYVWRPSGRYRWRWNRDFAAGQIQLTEPPENAVFFVIVTMNKDKKYRTNYPAIYGWIEHWGWVGEDTKDKGHPEGWRERYTKKVVDGRKTKKSAPSAASRRKK